MQFMHRFKESAMKHLRTLQFIDVVARVGSIRKAADELAINSTALNRQILAFEEEFGVAVFERLPRGVRLSTAGELLIQHIRAQMADFSRLRSQIADLSGVRRGHVSIAATRAALPYFLPLQIATYRQTHSSVTFDVQQRDRNSAEESLLDYSADIALAFEPTQRSEFQTLISVSQPAMVIMRATHPLARDEVVRLGHCLEYPLALPSASAGVRELLEQAAAARSLNLEPEVESESAQFLISYVQREDLLTFDLPLGVSEDVLGALGLVARRLDSRDAPEGRLYLGQLKGRTLPVAVAKFADQLQQTLAE